MGRSPSRFVHRSQDSLSLLVGAVVFTGGFGVLNVFWFLGTWRRDVLGLWDFRSATIGDGLLLPVAAGILTAAGGRLPRAAHERLAKSAAAILGVSLGALQQLALLRDPDLQLNWTIPGPRTFNAAGIYHAVFVTVTCGVFAALTVRLVWRLRSAHRVDSKLVAAMLRSPASALLVACLFAFVGLLLLDSFYIHGQVARHSFGTIVTILAAMLGTLLTCAVVVLSIGRSLASTWRLLGWGILLGTAICVAAWRPSDLRDNLGPASGIVVLAMSVAIAINLWRTHDRFWWIRTLTATPLVVGGVSESLTVARSNLAAALGLTLASVVGAGLVFGLSTSRQARRLTLALVFPAALLVFATWARTQSTQVTPIAGVAWALLGIGILAIIPVAQFLYVSLIEDEETLGPSQNPADRQRLEESYWGLLTTMAVLCIGTVAASLDLLDASGAVSGLHAIGDASIPYVPITAIGLAVVVGLALVAVRRSRPRTPVVEAAQLPAEPNLPEPKVPEPKLRMMTGVALVATVAALGWAAIPWVATLVVGKPLNAWGPWHTPVVFYAIGGVNAAWLGFITIDSLRANIARIEFFRLDAGAWVVTIASGIAIASTWAWLWSVGVWAQGGWAPLAVLSGATAIVYFGGVAVISIDAWALERSSPPQGGQPGYLSLHHPAAQVFNDELLYGFSVTMTVFAVFTVDQVLSTTPLLQHLSPSWLGPVLTLASTFLTFAPAFLLASSNTDRHVEHERARISGSMLARTGEIPELAAKWNKERVERIQHRYTYVYLVTFLMSPFGAPARIWNWLKQWLGN